jgi:hypothetical protein
MHNRDHANTGSFLADSLAPYTVGELAAARSILAGLPRDLPEDVVPCVLDSVAALARTQGLLTGDEPIDRIAETYR